MAAPSATTPKTSTAIDAFVRLVRANAAVTRQLSAQLSADHGLNISAYEALLQLARAPESRMRRVDLANGLLLTAGGVTRLLDGLERDGLVARESARSDRRVSYAVLTEAGRAKLRRPRSLTPGRSASSWAARTTRTSSRSSSPCSIGCRASTPPATPARSTPSRRSAAPTPLRRPMDGPSSRRPRSSAPVS